MQRLFASIWRRYGVLGLCFAVSIGLHVVGLVVFGSYKLFSYLYQRDSNFEAAPFRKKAVQLRAIQHKVMLKKPPKARVIRRLSVNKLAQVNLPVMPNKDALLRKFEVSKNFLDGGNIFSDFDVAESVFGSAKRMDNSFEGTIYALADETRDLPRNWPGKPLGKVYTSKLDVPKQWFDKGFPGVSDRFEWFGVDYVAQFYVKETGNFSWWLTTDDGGELVVDGKVVLRDPIAHPANTVTTRQRLTEGTHSIRVKYYQGPKVWLALQLHIQPPNATQKVVFNLNDYPVPANEKL